MAADVAQDSGGVADHVTALTRELRNRGLSVELLWGSDVPSRWPGPLRGWRFSWAAGRRARKGGHDVVHAHTSAGGLCHLMVGPRTTCVTTSHGDERDLWAAEKQWSSQGGQRVRLRSRVLVPSLRLPLFTASARAADGVIALTGSDTSRYRGERSEPSTVATVPNAARAVAGSAEPVPGRVVYVGTWIWRKGSDTLLDAFTELSRHRPDAVLHLVGPAADTASAWPPHLRDKVVALGYLTHEGVDAELRQADVLVLPSRFEGMPLVVLDALAYGVPVVATDLPGTRAAVGQAGRLVPVGDAHAFARAVQEIIDDRPLRAALSEQALADSARRTWADVASLTKALYDQAAENRPTTRLERLGRVLPGFTRRKEGRRP